MSGHEVTHIATVGTLTECARQIRRLIMHTRKSVWVYAGGERSDLHVVSVEKPEWFLGLIGTYNEHASVDDIAEDIIHHAQSIGVHLVGCS
jgi:hypothetical protein